LERIRAEKIFQPRVFFVQNLGFMTPSDARRISFEEALSAFTTKPIASSALRSL
jgi:predicted ATPase